MKPFYSVAELANLLKEDCYTVKDGLIACGATLIHGGRPADLSRWIRPVTRNSNGSFTVIEHYPEPDPEHVIVVIEALPASWAKSISEAEGDQGEANDLQQNKEDENIPDPSSRAHVSNKLAKMNQAAMKFWGNADRYDRGTHPDNATVAAWLVKQDFSQTLADKAATIIRPEWVPTGRKPEE